MSTEQLHVVNLGARGALVEAALPLPINAEYRMQLVLEGDVTQATVKIRRVVVVGDTRPPRYHIGLEFLSMSSDAEEMIQRLLAPPQDETLTV